MEDTPFDKAFDATLSPLDTAVQRTVTPASTPKPKRLKPWDFLDVDNPSFRKVLEESVRKFGGTALKQEATEAKIRQLIGEVNASRLMRAGLEERQAYFDGIKDQVKASELNLLRKSVLFKDVI